MNDFSKRRKEPVEVVSSSIVSTGTGKRVFCQMSDGSHWTCDMEGNDWIKAKLSDYELTDRFTEHVETTKTAEAKGSSKEAE